MGLSLRMKGGVRREWMQSSIHVGAYHQVHVLRALVAYLLAAVIADQQPYNEAAADAALELIPYPEREIPLKLGELVHAPTPHGSWLDYLEQERPCYEGIADAARDLVERGSGVLGEHTIPLVGLAKLVHHSDCDGWHSPGDVADIARMLDALAPVMERKRLSYLAGEPRERPPYSGEVEGLAFWLHRVKAFLQEARTAGAAVVYA